MDHEHDQGCRHDLKFCYQCDVPYCAKCNAKWVRDAITIYYSPLNPAPVPSGGTGDFPLPYTFTTSGHTTHATEAST